MSEITPAGRVEMARREIPYAVQRLTQFAVDNPAQVALIAAAAIVVTAAARNIVRPKTLIEAVALMAVLDAGGALAAKQVFERGWLNFRVRDADGALVTVRPGMEN
jgi:hypothetical protein